MDKLKQGISQVVNNTKYSDEDMQLRNEIASLGYQGQDLEDIFNSAKKSQRESIERNRAKAEQLKWEEQNSRKPKNTTKEQIDKIRKHAIKHFGITDDFNRAFYMLPDGRLLNGSLGGFDRDTDHREIGDSYVANNVDIQELNRGGNTHNMEDFMRQGHLRVMPENKSIELYTRPTSEQYRSIVNLWRNGKLDNLEVDRDYLENIESESQIANFFRKHFTD